MEKNPEDPEFWLPSDFLCDDIFLGGGGKDNSEVEAAGDADSCFPGEITFGFGSDPPSPVESVTGTESDEEDCIVGLTEKMARSFLQDDEKGTSFLPSHDSKGVDSGEKMHVLAVSPQSTLSPWLASGRGSPSAPSLVSSPPSSPLEKYKDDPWDMLYEAAGQVMRLRLNEKSVYGRGLLGLPRMPSPPISVSSKNANPRTNANSVYHHNPVLTPRQLQEVQFYRLQQQQLMKQQHSADRWVWQHKAKGGGGGAVYGGDGRSGGRPLGLPSSAWPPLQKQQQQHQQPLPGSGMRAVFLTGSGARRESAGTGVFLPRRVGSPSVSRKKPACSTVLLPDRVVQALNINLEELGAQQRYPGGFVLDHDALVDRSNSALSHQKRNHLHPPPAAVASQDIRLPPEWTY